jgi:hypothetical protein
MPVRFTKLQVGMWIPVVCRRSLKQKEHNLSTFKTYCHIYQVCVIVWLITTWIQIGYWIYSLWRFTAAHVTIIMNTIALIAPWIPLTELYCVDVSLGGLISSASEHSLTHWFRRLTNSLLCIAFLLYVDDVCTSQATHLRDYKICYGDSLTL